MHRLLRGMQLLDVQPQVSFPAARGGTELALEYWLVAGVNKAMGFQRVALREPRMTYVTLVGFLPSVNAQVPL